MEFLKNHTYIKVSKDKAAELIKKSKLVYLTYDNYELLTSIYYVFNYDSKTYYLSINSKNIAIILLNDNGVNDNLYQWIKKSGNKTIWEIFNIDCKSSYVKQWKLVDYFYKSELITNRQFEHMIIRYLNDNKDYLTNEELTRVKKWLINNFGNVPLTIDNIIDYINNLRGNKQLLYKEALTMINGTTLQLVTWLIDKEDKEVKN